jgi:hypothetical protein
LSRAPLIPLIGIGLIGLGNYPNPSHQRRSHKAARERGLASARRMAETGRSLAFAGRCPFFALVVARAGHPPPRIMCGSEPLKTHGSEQTSEIRTLLFLRCNLLRPWWLRHLPFGLPANCRTTLRFRATGTANSKDYIILLTRW